MYRFNQVNPGMIVQQLFVCYGTATAARRMAGRGQQQVRVAVPVQVVRHDAIHAGKPGGHGQRLFGKLALFLVFQQHRSKFSGGVVERLLEGFPSENVFQGSASATTTAWLRRWRRTSACSWTGVPRCRAIRTESGTSPPATKWPGACGWLPCTGTTASTTSPRRYPQRAGKPRGTPPPRTGLHQPPCLVGEACIFCPSRYTS